MTGTPAAPFLPRPIHRVGFDVGDPATGSARLESLGFGFKMYARIGEVEFFWHDGAPDWDGRDPIRSLRATPRA